MSKAEEYLKKSICKCQEGDRPYNEWVSTDCAKLAIEIARKEMIERACEYLDLHCNEIKTEDNGIAGWIDNEFIDNFRKAMRNEVQD